MRRQFVLPFNERRRLHRRAHAAQQLDHLEVCGVLVADHANRLKLEFLQNRSRQPYKFLVSLDHVSAVRRSAKRNGHRFLGLFHSHPLGDAVPGPRDRRTTRPGWLHLIYDVCGREVRLWRIIKPRSRYVAKQVPLVLEPESRRVKRAT